VPVLTASATTAPGIDALAGVGRAAAAVPDEPVLDRVCVELVGVLGNELLEGDRVHVASLRAFVSCAKGADKARRRA
jgi:hypothetical protein